MTKGSLSLKNLLPLSKQTRPPQKNGESLKDINDTLYERANNKALKEALRAEGKNYELRPKLYFRDKNEVQIAYDEAVKEYSKEVTKFLGPKTSKGEDFKLSRERAALIVVDWLCPALARKASQTENRAEAWFKIRYGWAEGKGENAKFNCGWAKRHYIESEIFGLYYNPDNVSLEEAKQVYKMFQRHKDQIAAREKLYGPGGSVKTEKKRGYRTAFEEANYGKKEVKTVAESFAPAKAVLLASVSEQYKDNPTLVAKLTDDINNFRPIDNYLNALKEVEKQPLNVHLEPEPVHAKKDHIQPSKEPLQPDNGLLSKIGEMGRKMHDSDVDAAKAMGQVHELMGALLDKMFAPANTEASEISPLKTNYQQTMNRPGEQRNDSSIVPVGELRKTASDALYAIYTRELEIRKFINENYGEPMSAAEIETAAVFRHLTEEEQGTLETAAKLTKEREELGKQTQRRDEIAEAYGYNRFYAKIPNFLKNDHQKRYDRWGRELEKNEIELTKREEANRPEIEKALAKISAPEFQEKKTLTAKEIKASDIERIKKLDSMGREWETFSGRRFSINYLKDKLPDKIRDMGIKVKGDHKDINNLLAQSDHITAQTKPAIEITRQYERGLEYT